MAARQGTGWPKGTSQSQAQYANSKNYANSAALTLERTISLYVQTDVWLKELKNFICMLSFGWYLLPLLSPKNYFPKDEFCEPLRGVEALHSLRLWLTGVWISRFGSIVMSCGQLTIYSRACEAIPSVKNVHVICVRKCCKRGLTNQNLQACLRFFNEQTNLFFSQNIAKKLSNSSRFYRHFVWN